MPSPLLLEETSDFSFFAKPRGIPTIPGVSARKEDSFWGQVESQSNRRLWVVHRLDGGTSGVIVFAKTAEAHAKANAWFESRRVKKRYWFIAEGDPRLPIYRVDDPIDGKRSLTQVRVISRDVPGMRGAGFRGEALPQTGRKHQIRIHLAAIGHPILGDVRYGAGPMQSGAFYLHARSLELPEHPPVEAPLPDTWSAYWPEAK